MQDDFDARVIKDFQKEIEQGLPGIDGRVCQQMFSRYIECSHSRVNGLEAPHPPRRQSHRASRFQPK